MVGSIRVVSKRKGGIQATSDETIIEGDRSNPILGNRHYLHNWKDPIERASVINKYNIYDLKPDIMHKGPKYQLIHEIANRVKAGEHIALRCWCKPLDCHLDLVAQYIQNLVDGKDILAEKEIIILGNPGINNGYYNLSNRYELEKDLIFVFGSNLAGRHGKGAALQAALYYNAVYGIGVGLTGNSYAIPTKDRYLRILPLIVIKEHVDNFIKFNKDSGKCFYITPIGTGLAGYKHKDIAPMFKEVKNCWLPDVWQSYLN